MKKKPTKNDYKLAFTAMIIAVMASTMAGILDRALPPRRK